MATTIATWISESLATLDNVAEYEIESDDDGAIFGDEVACVSGMVAS
jgi:hypothetical protein